MYYCDVGSEQKVIGILNISQRLIFHANTRFYLSKNKGEHKNEKPKTVKKDKCVDIEYKKIYLEIFDVIKLKLTGS